MRPPVPGGAHRACVVAIAIWGILVHAAVPADVEGGCEAPDLAVEERPKFVLEDRGDGYRRCVEAGEDAGGGRGGGGEEEVEGLSLVVLDGTYAHPISGEAMLTPQLRTSHASWAQSGLLDRTRERVLFIQEIRVEHCILVAGLTGAGASFIVVGNVAQVGIPNGQAYLFRIATSARLLFLERDFATLDDRPNLRAHLEFAEAALRGGGGGTETADPKAGVVLLRGCCGHRDGGDSAGSSVSVCDKGDDRYLRAAFETDVVWTTSTARAFSSEKCAAGSKLRWDPPGLFFTSNTAFEWCRERAEAAQVRGVEGLPSGSKKQRKAFVQDSMVQRCSARNPVVYCHRSLTTHWSNNPWMANRAFVLTELLPRYPDCRRVPEAQRAFCNYLGVESNRELQCHLRSLNYTVWQTEGVFRHLDEERSDNLRPCNRGEGYAVQGPRGGGPGHFKKIELGGGSEPRRRGVQCLTHR